MDSVISFVVRIRFAAILTTNLLKIVVRIDTAIVYPPSLVDPLLLF